MKQRVLYDNESESAITEVLEEVSKDKITFVIAHRLSTIKNADKIMVFKEGEIIGQGNQEELLENCGRIQTFIRISKYIEEKTCLITKL